MVLYCNTTGSPKPKIQWKNQKNIILRPTPLKYTLNTNMLIIRRFEYPDIGIYTCQVINELENNNTLSINVNLKKAGKSYNFYIVIFFK